MKKRPNHLLFHCRKRHDAVKIFNPHYQKKGTGKGTHFDEREAQGIEAVSLSPP